MTLGSRPDGITARIRALDRYCAIELNLAMLLSAVLQVKVPIGEAVFRSTTTRSRYRLIDDLLKGSENKDCLPFWNSLCERVKRLDETRNKIVHWASVFDLGTVGGSDPSPPGGADITMKRTHQIGDATAAAITLADLKQFSHDAEEVGKLLAYFSSFVRGHFDEDMSSSMRLVFQRAFKESPVDELQAIIF